MNRFGNERCLKRQSDAPAEVTIYSSGYLLEDPHSLEVTLTGYPAVSNAMFRITRSKVTGKDGTEKDQILTAAIPVNSKKEAKRQVFGYVSVPWLEDSYGDILDPKSIEQAAHSFMHNLITKKVEGNTGIGEEHTMFYEKAYPIQSVIDYNGSIGGIPGGWWLGTQITDPDVWEKVASKQYVGYSLGSMVFYVNTTRPDFREEAFKSIPNLASIEASTPAKGKLGALSQLGIFGYPEDKSAYADPTNLKFPLNTAARAFATLRYVVDNYEAEGYTKNELKYMLSRMVSSLVRFEVEVPEAVRNSLGIKAQKSLIASVLSVVRGLSTLSTEEPTKEVDEMDRSEVTELVQKSVKDAVTEEIKLQASAIKEDIQQSVATTLTDFTTKIQTSIDAMTQTIAAKAAPEKPTEADKKDQAAPDSATTIATAVVEALKTQGIIKSEPAQKDQSVPENPLDIKAAIQSMSQQLSELSKATSGRLTARKTMDDMTEVQKLELMQRRKDAPFDVDPTFMTGSGVEDEAGQ